MEGLNLFLVATDLNYQRIGCDIYDIGPEDIHDLHDFTAGLYICLHFYEGEFSGYDVLIRDVGYSNHIDKFVKMLGHLFDDLVIALYNKSHTRQIRLFTVPNG